MGGAYKKHSKETEAMNKYQKLLDYYKACFSLVDCFHFNSEISKNVYMDYLPSCKGRVVSITHDGIRDHREIKTFNQPPLHIGFIGNSTSYKGLPLLISVLQSIGKTNLWDLSVWGGSIGKHPFLPIYYKGKFDASTISSVFGGIDVLVVPSVWKETFSFVTLEALSYGVPVIVSDNVGAQDLVKQYNPRFVYKTKMELKSLLFLIMQDNDMLKQYNQAIIGHHWDFDMQKHANEIISQIYE